MNIDDEGRCPSHAFVQISRRSSRTGEWKTLLDNCPLCVIDSNFTTGSQRRREEESENRLVDAATAPVTRLRGHGKMPPPPSRRSSSTSSGGSRVRFHSDKDEEFTSTTAPKSVLRAPKYKVCEELMRQQSEDTAKLSTMSDDIDIRLTTDSDTSTMEFSTLGDDDDDDGRSGIIKSQNEEKSDDQTDRHVEKDGQCADIEGGDDELVLPLHRLAISPSLPKSLQKDSDVASRNMQDKEERVDGNKSAHRSRRSHQKGQADRHPSDRKESLGDEASSSGGQTSNQVHRLQKNSSSQSKRTRRATDSGEYSSQSRQQGRREVEGGDQTRRISAPSNISHRHREHKSPHPGQDASSVSPSPQIDNSTQTYINGLTFTGRSEQHEDTTLSSATKVTNNTEPASELTLSTMMTDKNEFDPKTGRCIHHPQVRLRKKQLLGKGWKVLMSTCPDCCVSELRRIRLARELAHQGYTRGHAVSLARTIQNFPLRIWVVDNSGSMQHTDGHRFVETSRKCEFKVVDCSRWNELRDCVIYHAQMAAALGAPTIFRMLNDPRCGPNSRQFSIGECSLDEHVLKEEVDRAKAIMTSTQPGGVTPLIQHIEEIRQMVKELEPNLRGDGCRVAIILATDGLPTDDCGLGGPAIQQQFVEALRGLEALPVWLVIRLCTDEEEVANFYNSLDEQLELSVDVLDDFLGESKEVHEHNPWLNYALPLHRLREMGYHDRLFDLLDERCLTTDELREFCSMLLLDGVASAELPDPSADW
jgi:hypothetical protein